VKKFLITGASGFIGKHLVPRLLGPDSEVHCVASKKPEGPGKEAPKNSVRWHVAELLNSSESEALFDSVKPTHLVHLAWTTEQGVYLHSPKNFAWVEASLSMLRFFKNQGGRRVVMAGSCSEFDWTGTDFPDINPAAVSQTPYGLCKNVLEKLLRSFCEAEKISGAWGRFFYTFGPHQGSDRLVPSIILSLLNGEIAKCSPSNKVIDFMYVEDLADAFCALINSKVTGPVNIASGKEMNLKDFILSIGKKMDCEDRIETDGLSGVNQSPDRIVADIKRLTDAVKWRGGIGIDRGLDLTIDWCKKIKLFSE